LNINKAKINCFKL